MQIAIAGKNEIALNFAKYIIKQGYEIIAIAGKSDTGQDSWQPSFRKFASRTAQIKLLNIEDIYTIKDLVFFSCEFEHLIKIEKFTSSNLFNIHFSLLPQYKGAYTSIMPILNNDNITGVTLHKIDHGVDTGDIIKQTSFPILADDTCRDLYFKYMDKGLELLKDNFHNIMNNNYELTKQPSINSSFHSRKDIDFSNITINFKQTAWQIHNYIRAFTFKEYQMVKLNGKNIYKSEILEEKSIYKFGYMVEESENFKIFSTIDYDIKLYFED